MTYTGNFGANQFITTGTDGYLQPTAKGNSNELLAADGSVLKLGSGLSITGSPPTINSSASFSGTSSQLTAGDGTAVNVGSGLSLAAGTLTSPSFSTVYDLEWANKTVPTTTPAAIVDSAGRSGTWYQYATGSGQTMTTDATGLKFTTGGSVSNPQSRFWLSLSSLGLSIYGSRYRCWSAISGWPSGFGWFNVLADGTENSGGNTTRTYNFIDRDVASASLKFTNYTGNHYSTNTTAFYNATCFMLEYDGCGTYVLRVGTYSGAWPSVANMNTLFFKNLTTSDMRSGSGDTGPTVEASGGHMVFTFNGNTATDSSGYLVRSRIDVG